MAEKKSYAQFRGLLRGAICNRTQAQFAKETGISPEHLSRMLNNPEINRPSQATLGKIASAAKNGITLQDLLNALDADDGVDTANRPSPRRTEQARQDFAPEFREMAEESMKFLCEVLDGEKWPAVADSPEECADALVSAANERIGNKFNTDGARISCECGKTREYFGNHVKNAARWMPVYLSMAGQSEAAEAVMLIYYNPMTCADGKTRAVIQHADCSAHALEDLYGTSKSSMDAAAGFLTGTRPWPEYLGSRDDIEVNGHAPDLGDPEDMELACMAIADALKYDLAFQPLARFAEKFRGRGSTAEQRLLSSIFGEKYRWPETLDGFGFDLDKNAPPEKLAAFLSAASHRKHVLDCYDPDGTNDEEGKYAELEKLLEDHKADPAVLAKALDAFEYQDPDGTDDEGWGSAVAAVMRAETGFPFKFRAAAADLSEFSRLSEKGCIILEKRDMGGIQREAMALATGRYARELGIKSFGDMLFTGVHQELRKPMRYTVKERPEEENGCPECEEDDIEMVEFDKTDADKKPAETGRYTVELKDGRITDLVWLSGHDIWLRARKEWSHLVARFSKTPLPQEDQDNPEDAGGPEDADPGTPGVDA